MSLETSLEPKSTEKEVRFYLVDSTSTYPLPLPQSSQLTNYYQESYSRSSPVPLDNLLTMYGLEDIAQSLARTKSDGSKGVKLRKSYKNHIADLPGKHLIPPLNPIPPQLLDPGLALAPHVIKEIDPALLRQALRFDKTPINGIPGFNTADLAINDQQTLMRGEDLLDADEAAKRHKRKRKSQTGNEIKRQHF